MATRLLLAAVLLTTACGGGGGGPSVAATVIPPVVAAPLPTAPVSTAPASTTFEYAFAAGAFPSPVERGFAHCCGNSSFRLDIQCKNRLMRCYVRDGFGGWTQTYGRHCKRELSEACYLHGCQSRC